MPAFGCISKRIPSFVIICEDASIQNLKPGEKLKAGTTLFWSSHGFAFETPGKHIIAAQILWKHGEILTGVEANTEIWLDYPVTNEDNKVASLLLDDEVGMFVALGGDAGHLKEAVSRIQKVISKHPKHSASKRLAKLMEQKQ